MKLEGTQVKAVKAQVGSWHIEVPEQDESFPGIETLCHLHIQGQMTMVQEFTPYNRGSYCQKCVAIAEQ